MAAVVQEVALTSIERLIMSLHGEPRPMAPRETGLLKDAGEAMIRGIRSVWPRDTSTSYDNWTFRVTTYPNIRIWLENPIEYVTFVHLTGTPPIPPLVDSLLPTVINAVIPQLLPLLRAEIYRTEQEIKRLMATGLVKRNAFLAVVRAGWGTA